MSTTMASTSTATPLSSSPCHVIPSLRRPIPSRRVSQVRAFRRSDLDGFARRVASGEALRGAWRSTSDGFELFLFEAKKAAQRLDRRYSFSRRLSTAVDRVDRDLEIGARWRSFSMDFHRNWPRYRKQFSDFLDTPLGRSASAVFFLWFAFSGWLFRTLVIATWVLPIAGPLLIGTLANNLVIKGECPACKRQFVGNKKQIICCGGCGNIVWQPQDQGSLFSRGGRNKATGKSDPEIIDVEFEEI